MDHSGFGYKSFLVQQGTDEELGKPVQRWAKKLALDLEVEVCLHERRSLKGLTGE